MTQYTVSQLAQLSGVSARTIRYYDQIGLLQPALTTEKYYRIYTEQEVDLLQQILYFRRLGFKLSEIKEIMENPNYDVVNSLKTHQRWLRQEVEELNRLNASLSEAIKYYQGEQSMTDDQKFQELKTQYLQENERLYGEELRDKYEEKELQQFNDNFANLSKEKYDAWKKAEEQLIKDLNILLKEPGVVDLDSPVAMDAFLSHQKWLKLIYPKYDSNFHRGIVQMYLADERFSDYYNSRTDGDSVELLAQIINHYV
ncbi:MerR family transcriptional regulator [Xylocopilactobacillus apicola]|uniref:MerR family transcriptional regulator n=1 Tax=Xylocopilactobacillus apicola TaxID=2932184 RepID=A0AAU9DL97_9LACO|nr:MerR family transcriptional regulator [Xylocopilactobacillus apicola]BDR59341.1 MerR family transcriptional regulator [Xylocopilactobacillus apicola]